MVATMMLVLALGQGGSLSRVAERLEAIRGRHDLPAMAAATIGRDGVSGAWAVGVRKRGGKEKATVNDRFHIGSCTKAMTATLLAILVESGKVKWSITLSEAFPQMEGKMLPEYRDVTLRQLLMHRGGFPGPERSWPEGMLFLDVHNLPGTPRQQRLDYVERALRQKPACVPGKKTLYSNMGYAIAGAAAEQAANTQWEALMRTRVFEPLGMATAGFGPAGEAEPWPHSAAGEPVAPSRVSDNPPAIAPAGTVHCSILDWARFIHAHLLAGRGKGALLSEEGFRFLHGPAFDDETACGWIAVDRTWGGGRVLTHAGSNTLNYAVAWLAPRKGFAVVVATNQGGDSAFAACDEAAAFLISARGPSR